jgi:hypothetical protein
LSVAETRGFHGGTSFGTFALADVTGAGAADLVEWGLLSGGAGPTRAFAVDVFAATDRPGPASPVPTTPEERGFSSVAAYNCQTERHDLYYWSFDTASGALDQSGPAEAMYPASGPCPDMSFSPETFDLDPGHVHALVAVDPEAIGCDGRNDPTILGCVAAPLTVRGASDGPICHWYIGGQESRCAP